MGIYVKFIKYILNHNVRNGVIREKCGLEGDVMTKKSYYATKVWTYRTNGRYQPTYISL